MDKKYKIFFNFLKKIDKIFNNAINNLMMSNFEKIKQFHTTFSHPCPNSLNRDVLENNPELVKLRLSLINEEVEELKVAMQQKNMTEVIDALTDILYVVYGAGAAFGINLDKSYDIVHESNMSKLCKNESEAIKTVDDYKKKYSEGDLKYDSPSFKLAPDNLHYIVYNQSTGKILKSINYTPANFSEIIAKD